MVGKRNLLRVTLNKFQIWDLGFEIFLPPFFRDFEHGPAEIQTDDIRAALRERQRQVAGAAAQVQRAVAGFHGGEFDDATFPAAVEAETLQVIKQIVAPGNGAEKVMDLRGALLARGIKDIAHLHSLAWRTGWKSKGIKCALHSMAGLLMSLLTSSFGNANRVSMMTFYEY